MKSLTITALLLSLVAHGNPIPVGDWAYISSERLDVTIHEDHAEIVGSFTFSSTAKSGRFDRYMSGDVSIPIWVPDTKSAPPELRSFLDSCTHGQPLKLTDAIRPSWDSLIGMKINCGKTAIQPDVFSIVDYASRRKAGQSHPAYQRKGFSCIVVSVSAPPTLIASGQTVRISYRQPLNVTRDGREFYYVPVFGAGPQADHMASEFVMSVTNRSGREMSLGGASIPNTRSATLPLSDMAAISIKSNEG